MNVTLSSNLTSEFLQLFGCMFCSPVTGICDRKNFDSLLWATITVFQVNWKWHLVSFFKSYISHFWIFFEFDFSYF